jgi:uncharacterized membrane protein YhaH (DUF805 family)
MVELLFSPSGRIGRRPFAIIFIIGILLVVASLLFLEFGYVYRGTFIMLFSLSLLLPALWSIYCVTAKRLHDRGRPRWHAALVWPLYEAAFLPGNAAANQYGEAVRVPAVVIAQPTGTQSPRAQFGRRS